MHSVMIRLKQETDERIKQSRKQKDDLTKSLKSEEIALQKTAQQAKDLRDKFNQLQSKLQQVTVKLSQDQERVVEVPSDEPASEMSVDERRLRELEAQL